MQIYSLSGAPQIAKDNNESGQSQFAPLKLRSLALVPSSGALPRPSELHLWQLHCETLPAAPRRSGQRLAAVPRRASRIIRNKVTASSRSLRALRPLHNRQLTVLVYALPASHREENNRPGAPYRRDRPCPESAKINIILSRLCHSSHQGSTTAAAASILVGQKPVTTGLPAAGEHNLDYVNFAPSVS